MTLSNTLESTNWEYLEFLRKKIKTWMIRSLNLSQYVNINLRPEDMVMHQLYGDLGKVLWIQDP